MTDQMNVSLANNGEKQGSVRSEDHEALKIMRSPVLKWRWSTSSYYSHSTVIVKPRERSVRSVRVPERCGSAYFPFWVAQPFPHHILWAAKRQSTSDATFKKLRVSFAPTPLSFPSPSHLPNCFHKLTIIKYGGRSRGSCQSVFLSLEITPLISHRAQVIDNGSGMCKAGCECSTESFCNKDS